MLKLKPKLLSISPAILFVGFLIHTGELAVRAFYAGNLPITNFHESLSFFAWLLVGLTLLAQISTRVVILGAFLSPIAFLMVLTASALDNPNEHLPPMLDTYWLPVHVTFAFLGNAVLTLAFGASLAYLVQEYFVKERKKIFLFKRLPSLEILDGLNQTFLIWGFPIMTLGILTGGVWAELHWGRSWFWEWRQVLSACTWLFYAFLLYGRLSMGWRGKRAAIWTITGFSVLMISYLVVNLALPGRHGGDFG
jgi:cytochrome c-type biogenesis protein CcsB